MGKFSAQQAAARARQIFERFGDLIAAAVSGSVVPDDFLAGLIGVEAGVGRDGQIKPEAKRFEKHVFAALELVRGGGRKRYGTITTARLRPLTDSALRNLASSWGLTQIMGWHVMAELEPATIAELRAPETHLPLAVKLLEAAAGEYLRANDFASVLRIWNTGRANGTTHDPNYVANSRAVAAAYREIAAKKSISRAGEPRPKSTVDQKSDENSLPAQPQAGAPILQTQTVEAPPPTGFLTKLKLFLGTIAAFLGGGAGLRQWAGVTISAETAGILKTVIPTAIVLGFAGLVIWYISEKIIGWKTLRLQAEIACDPARPNLKIDPK